MRRRRICSSLLPLTLFAIADSGKGKFLNRIQQKIEDAAANNFTPQHAAIVLHKKHVMPKLAGRQEMTLKTSCGGKVDPTWISNYNLDRPDYLSLSVHAGLKIQESRHLGKKGVIPLHAR